MYLKELELHNIRCFENLKLSFDVEDTKDKNWHPEWTMILGKNSTGKSTILKLIGHIFCLNSNDWYFYDRLNGNYKEKFIKKDSSHVNPESLISTYLNLQNMFVNYPRGNTRVAQGIAILKNEFVYSDGIEEKKDTKDLRIGISFVENIDKKIELATTHIKNEDSYSKKNFLYSTDKLLCGYGPNRNIAGFKQFNKDINEYEIENAFKTLFLNNQDLGNLELYLVEAEKRSPQRYSHIMRSLKTILMLNDKEDIIVSSEGIFIKTSSGVKINVKDIGEGYKTTIAWLLDLFGWALVSKKNILDKETDKLSEGRELSGIVIIDELEQHLHPSWQRKIVPYLRKVFPKIQFITTTHSPLVASGLADIENAKLIVLKDNGIEQIIDSKDINGYTIDRILDSDIFGHTPLRNETVSLLIEKYEELFIKPKLADEEITRFEELKRQLKEILPEYIAETEGLRRKEANINDMVTELKRLMSKYSECADDKDQQTS